MGYWILGGLAGLLLALVAYSEFAAGRFEAAHPPIGEIVALDEARIHLFDSGPKDGAASPIVLIHGASANLRDMHVAFADALPRDRRVIIVDRPGHGYSTRPADGWRLEVQAKLIRDALVEKGVSDPIIVGQSFGGAVALAYALQFQEEMTGLGLLAPVSHEWPGGVAWYNAASATPVVGHALRRLVLPFYGPYVARDGFPEAFAPGAPPENYAERAGVALLFRPSTFKNNALDMVNLKVEIVAQQDRYGELDLAAFVATGAVDDDVSPELHAAALGREIPGIEHVVLPDTGHTLHHAETEQIVDLILALDARATAIAAN